MVNHYDQDDNSRPKKIDWPLFWRVIGLLKPYTRQRNALLTVCVIRACQIPMISWLVSWVLAGPINQRDWQGTLTGSMWVLVLTIFTQVTVHFRMRWAQELGEKVVRDIRLQIFDKLQQMPMAFFDQTKLGSMISRVTSDAEALRRGAQDVLFVSLVQAGHIVVAAVLMLWVDPVLFGIVLLMSPVLLALGRYFPPRIGAAWQQVQESFSKVTSTLAESVNGIRVTQGFVRQDENAERFQEIVENHGRLNLFASKLQATFLPLIELNNQTFYALLLIIGGYQVLVLEGSFLPAMEKTPAQQFESMVFFFFLAGIFFGALNFIARLYDISLSAMAGAQRVFDLLDQPVESLDQPDAYELPLIQGRVELNHLTFGYDTTKPVIHDVSFVAEPGQSIALVGHTGSGKSTIIKLISKLYLPTSGELMIDGHRIQAVTTTSLVKQVAVVLQHNYLFTGTILENIKTGRPDATDEQAIQAVRDLDCLDLFERLPEGLHTRVGERGMSLSLGQRQLVCFCRAMLADSRILILDEATSSVDTITEVRIQKALARLLEGRTSFIVAHRLSTIRHADQVLVLDQGRLIEQGTHVQLLEQDGTYAHLYRQFVHATDASN